MSTVTVVSRLRAQAEHPALHPIDSLCLHGLANVIERDARDRAYVQMVLDCFLDLLDDDQ